MSHEKLNEGSARLREKVLETLEKSPHPLSILAVHACMIWNHRILDRIRKKYGFPSKIDEDMHAIS